MCRMLIAVGTFNSQTLLQNASAMAQDVLSEHELNNFTKGNFPHKDGWGIAKYNPNTNKWITYKSTKPIWTNYKLTSRKVNNSTTKKETKQHSVTVTIIHTRRATIGKISMANTHPFELTIAASHDIVPQKKENQKLQKYFFCHNGTIKDNIPQNKVFSPKGTTDSEKLFHSILENYLLTKNPIDIRNTINQYNYPGASNIILSTNEKSLISINCKKNPHYTHMHLFQGEQGILISSEKLPNFQPTTILTHGTIIEIDHHTTKITMHTNTVEPGKETTVKTSKKKITIP